MVYHPPEVPQLIEACFDLIIKTAIKIDDPFEQAFFLMVQLPYLQPFEDVNKRVSRLSANIPLIKYNLAPLSFIDVPKSDYVSGLLAIYELNKIDLMRDVFVWAYERSAKQYRLMQATLTQPDLAHMQFKDELQEIIQYIITSHIRGAEIVTAIQAWAEKNIMIAQQVQFTRLAEKEMASLHEGNIAIYRIDPVLFAKWKNA